MIRISCGSSSSTRPKLARMDSEREQLLDNCQMILETTYHSSTMRELTKADREFNDKSLDELFLKAHGL